VATPRALVIGGSVGGLFAANLLRSIGWNVAVFERAAGHLGDRGTGIGTREELFAAMRRIGLTVEPSIGVDVGGRIGLHSDGSVAHERLTPSVTSAWSRIWQPLNAALPAGVVRGAATLVRFEQSEHGVTAFFNDGTSATGDLLVAADGLHSTVRSQLWPPLTPQYAGYVAWRGVVEQRELPPELHAMMFERMVFGFPEGELMLSLPMPGRDDGPHRSERRCHFVWFRPVHEDALPGLCTDIAGRRHGVSIPPPLIRPDLIAALKADATARLAPQLAALVHGTAQILLQPIFDLESPRVVSGRVVLLGDAAFVARPHVATGVLKAALDAQSLADALQAGGLEAGLARYEADRRPSGSRLVARGRHIAGYFSAHDPMQQRIERLMLEYGAAGVVGAETVTAQTLAD
jgi:2-polyprenyl-6-methoxyphenol hydroxylase-like FAD-dependent oxidoreductase